MAKKIDWKKIGKGAGIALGSAAGTALTAYIGSKLAPKIQGAAERQKIRNMEKKAFAPGGSHDPYRIDKP